MTCYCGCPGAFALLGVVCWNPACRNYHESDCVRLSQWTEDEDGTNPRVNGDLVADVREFLKNAGQAVSAFLDD